MMPLLPGLLLLAALPVGIVLLRLWPRAAVALALAGAVLPFWLDGPPLARTTAAIFACLFVVKTLQFAAGHERPAGALEFVLYLFAPAVVRWETSRRPDLARAGRCAGRGVLQLGLAAGLVAAVLQLDERNPLQLFTTQVGIYLVLAGLFNLAVAPLALRGIDFDDPFDQPFAARTPLEFWSRWNTWVSHLLHRYVFLPAGGRGHPPRASLAAFAVSALWHEAMMDLGTGRFSGWMGGFFLVQAGLVALTTLRPFRLLARRAPGLAWAITLTLMLATGVILVRGIEGVDPSAAWVRVFGER